MSHGRLVDLKLVEHFVVTLENLDRIPSLLFFRKSMYGCLLNMSESVFDCTGEGVHRYSFAVLRGIDSGFRSLHHACSF